MGAAGFKKYARFFERQPSIVVEWHDDRTDAVGWLCIDTLRGGAAGGGTRMRAEGSREEAVFLAKTMGVKFQVCGPDIGGGKSVIRFDPLTHPKEKRGVLERWYRHVGPYLKDCYGTGGDVNVDEVSEASAITAAVVGIGHPQQGICAGHMSPADGEAVAAKVARLTSGCEAMVKLDDLPGPRDGAWMVADVVTGLGVARAVETYYAARGMKLEGERVSVEGFGAVGAFAAYYLEQRGCRLVAASTRDARGFRVAIDEEGFDVRALIASREGTSLPKPKARKSAIFSSDDADELFEVEADIFIPAAASHTIDGARLKQLRRSGVKVWSCGANNPFARRTKKHDLVKWVADMLDLQRKADEHFEIIPDFVANCGMARAFAYLMGTGASTKGEDILADAARCVDDGVRRLLKGHRGRTGLLSRGYEVFIPDDEA
ncbi:MAG: Glu/Leu/Phe/Val dehydrogenase dimerization domain-containing protein [Planctomycetota bacterium]|nr:Glu/Leu/Phe/Val dehydrogenase dimerization domain-containing protein [Planctomycetota bacterium]